MAREVWWIRRWRGEERMQTECIDEKETWEHEQSIHTDRP